ncbi:hypothetical protein DFH08DRAFT_1038984 [Mycena albidolilacea]|uniref:Uncharacterized protein n=1 Tax=Mycena albidolilacea TaxID=1033008 RepID=A0AAD7AIM3_9AGAR|nr:hypothetical protein DFH08DRAFT_1038984 [Mycena albidolilacea]
MDKTTEVTKEGFGFSDAKRAWKITTSARRGWGRVKSERKSANPILIPRIERRQSSERDPRSKRFVSMREKRKERIRTLSGRTERRHRIQWGLEESKARVKRKKESRPQHDQIERETDLRTSIHLLPPPGIESDASDTRKGQWHPRGGSSALMEPTRVHPPAKREYGAESFASTRRRRNNLLEKQDTEKENLKRNQLTPSSARYTTSTVRSASTAVRPARNQVESFRGRRGWRQTLEYNHSLAEQRLGEALFARLLIFRMFLEIAKDEGLAKKHKTRRLLLQLVSHLGDSDIFKSLAYTRHSETLNAIRELLGSDFHLFLALDRGQAPARTLNKAYHTEPGKYPFLLKILDTWDKYIPAESSSCVITGTTIPEHIFEALKYRHTEALLIELLVWNFQQPNTVLDRFIDKTTRIKPADGGKWTEFERNLNWVVPERNRYSLGHVPLDFSSLYCPDADRRLSALKDNKTQAVSLSYGRFVDRDMRDIAFDEPTFLTAMQGPPSTAKALAACLAFYFSHAFNSSPKLCDVFTFPAPGPAPAWAKQSAQLVELHSDTGKLQCSEIPGGDHVGPLATSADSLSEVVSWMEHSNRTPFCTPAAEASTPDLLFVLKLEDGECMWVIMQVAPVKSDGSDLLESLKEERLFCDAISRGASSISISGSILGWQEHNADSSLHKRVIELLNAPPAKGGPSTQRVPTELRVLAANLI